LTKLAIHVLLLTLKGPTQYLKIKERGVTDPATNVQYKGQNDSYRNANHIVCPKIYIGAQCLPSTSSSNTCGSVEVSENRTISIYLYNSRPFPDLRKSMRKVIYPIELLGWHP
jgi:hypothetical protein